jgi:hypothetical protein
MDITAQQKALFEQEYPFLVEFHLDSDRQPLIRLRFPNREQFNNQLFQKTPFVAGYTIDFNGKKHIVEVTKAKVLFYKSPME